MVEDPYIERVAGGGGLILLGLAAKWLNHKTRVPDIFFLMLGGYLAGPVLGLANPDNYAPLITLFTSIALAFFMFWVGSTLHVKSLFRGFEVNVKFTLVAYALTSLTCIAIGAWFGIPFFSILLIAVLMSDTCPTIVNSVIRSIRLTTPGKVGMVIESSVSNSLGLALFLGLLPFAAIGAFDVLPVAESVAWTFGAAIVIGVLYGLAWVRGLGRVRDSETFTWLTLAGLLLLYALVESVHAAAPISALIFGFMVANAHATRSHAVHGTTGSLPFSVQLQEHILFFIRTAFFAYMGSLFPAQANLQLAAFAITVLVAVGLLRGALVFLYPQAFTKKDVIAQAFVYPTGFSAVMLTFIPQTQGITIPFLVEGVLYVVLFSNLISAAASWLHENKHLLAAFTKADLRRA